MKPGLSIIVPAYNVEKYIHKCFLSIINQEYTNFEVILIDDGSTDSTGLICEEYAAKDCRIKVTHKKNGGLSSALNTGLDLASGTFIGFVDSDDYISPRMFNVLMSKALSHGADIAECLFSRFYGDECKTEQKGNASVHVFSGIEALQKWDYVTTVIKWNKVYKAELFNGIRFPLGKIHEDEFVTYKLIYNVDKIVRIDEVYYYYRVVSTSITAAFSEKKMDILNAFQERIEFFRIKGNALLCQKSIYGFVFTLIQLYITDLKQKKISKSKKDELWKVFKSLYKSVLFNQTAPIALKVKCIVFRINPYLLLLIKWIFPEKMRI